MVDGKIKRDVPFSSFIPPEQLKVLKKALQDLLYVEEYQELMSDV